MYLWRNNKKRLPSSLAKPNEMAVFFYKQKQIFYIKQVIDID